MSLMKSILLGSAAGIVAVASAQAADLPTRKAAPAEYVKICNVGGMAGFIIPGSDTCLKIGGYVTAQFTGGNLETGYSWGGTAGTASRGTNLVASPSSLRPDIGYNVRLNLSIDTRTNTAYGVLRGYAEIQVDHNNGFDSYSANGVSTSTDAAGPAGAVMASYINLAYVQWAGVTAGKAPSFFSFYGGGEGWANIFSPDQQGFNQPDILAYTATFGGGFSATIAAQSAGPNSPNFTAAAIGPGGGWGASGGGTNLNINTTNLGMEAPDVVANLRVDQAWGAAQVSGVAHQVRVVATGLAASQNTWGWGIDGGVKFNLPTLGAGDLIQFQAVWTKNAIWYSGIPDGMWGENGAVNGNGLAMSVGDTYFAAANKFGPSVFATPTAWSIGGTFEHHFSPVFSFDPEASYAQLNWSNSNGQLSSNSQSWIIGGVAHWDPVPLLDFAFEVLYQNTHQSTPGLWGTTGTVNGVVSAFPSNSSGVAGRFYITRNF